MLGNADYCVDIIMIILFVFFFCYYGVIHYTEVIHTKIQTHTHILDDATNVRVIYIPLTTEWFI